MSVCRMRLFAAVIGLVTQPLFVNAQDAIVLARRFALSESGLVPSDSGKVQIPRKVDPSADLRLIKAAAEIESIDRALSDLRVDDKFSKVQLEAFVVARNIAMDNLVSGREILIGTAGGEFPRPSQSAVTDMLAAIKNGLREPKGRDMVATEITYKTTEARKFAMEYQTYYEFSAKSDRWSTYQLSEVLTVGTYNFRVTLEKGKQCAELVAIMSQPTKRAICGRLVQ